MAPSTPSSETISIQITTNPTPIRALALETWHPTYERILAPEQIAYMLDQVYSLDSLQQQMENGQTFLLLTSGERPAAFAAYSCLEEKTHRFKLNKLYIQPAYQGRGFGRLLLQEVTKRVKLAGGQKLELNVHRQNPAQDFYRKHGFKIEQIIDLPFGPFTLNDYIMVLNTKEPEGDLD